MSKGDDFLKFWQNKDEFIKVGRIIENFYQIMLSFKEFHVYFPW